MPIKPKVIFFFPASLGLICVMLCSVALYSFLTVLFLCVIHLVLFSFNEPSLLYKLSLSGLINLSTVWAWVVVWTDLISFSLRNLFIFADLIGFSSSGRSCFGFPIEVNISFKPSITASGVLSLMGYLCNLGKNTDRNEAISGISDNTFWFHIHGANFKFKFSTRRNKPVICF